MPVAETVTVNGFDYGFDFEDTRIDIDAALSGVNVIELYTAIKDVQDTETAMPYDVIGIGEGLTILDSAQGISTFLTLSLQSTWEINTLRTSGAFSVSGGNLVRADNADPFRDNPLLTYFNNLSQAGVVTEVNTGSGVTEQDKQDIKNLIFSEVMEGSESFAEAVRLMRAEAAGRVIISGSTVRFRNAADSADRITAIVDANGQRISVTTDGN